MDDLRGRDLTAQEVAAVPEVMELPEGARVLDINSYGTYDGTRFDGIDPCALHDCVYVSPQPSGEAARWLEDRLKGLGWPGGSDTESAPVGAIQLPWRVWSREKEKVELIDFTTADWTMVPSPPAGWSILRLNYSRKPAREFASEDEYRVWLEDSGDKGERWRNRESL